MALYIHSVIKRTASTKFAFFLLCVLVIVSIYFVLFLLILMLDI